MTNTEYEKASVEAALGPRKLAAVDAKITETEQALVYLLHQRREIVNQYDLNKPKCEHEFGNELLLSHPPKIKCNRCGYLKTIGSMAACQHDFESVNIVGLGCVSSVCRKCGAAK